MQPELIIAALLALPIALLMAAFIWYLNIKGFYIIVKSKLRKEASALNTTTKIRQAY